MTLIELIKLARAEDQLAILRNPHDVWLLLFEDGEWEDSKRKTLFLWAQPSTDGLKWIRLRVTWRRLDHPLLWWWLRHRNPSNGWMFTLFGLETRYWHKEKP